MSPWDGLVIQLVTKTVCLSATSISLAVCLGLDVKKVALQLKHFIGYATKVV